MMLKPGADGWIKTLTLECWVRARSQALLWDIQRIDYETHLARFPQSHQMGILLLLDA